MNTAAWVPDLFVKQFCAGKRGTASSHLTFVAIDADEHVRPVPELAVETDRERELQRSARRAE
nr:hypothetical protein [Halobaculum halophilum]